MELIAVENGLAAVESRLRNVVDSDVDILHEASHHIVESGGKRIRPRITLLAYLAAGGKDVEKIVDLAAAIEMVHTATLVHDDINDHSLLRRGRITVHARWGRTFALLTGDFLFTKVYELMAPYGVPYNAIMAEACVRLVEGETLQAAAAKSGNMDRETYKQIIARKTASLFEAGARMGAILAGADEPIVGALAEYGHNLGLAFQIVDDILDIIGDPEALGKPTGLDVTHGMGALMTQNGRKVVVGGDQIQATAEADPIQEMLLRLRESGAVEVARMQAVEVGRRAEAALDALPPSPARNELCDLVALVLRREQ
jgi:geranylgeranyl pyrophosphate synthase